MTEDQRAEIDWALTTLEQALKNLWVAERQANEARIALSRKLHDATTRSGPEGT